LEDRADTLTSTSGDPLRLFFFFVFAIVAVKVAICHNQICAPARAGPASAWEGTICGLNQTAKYSPWKSPHVANKGNADKSSKDSFSGINKKEKTVQ
jgi:hypothetical protein